MGCESVRQSGGWVNEEEVSCIKETGIEWV